MLGEPWFDGDDLYWLEGRPAEGGRRVLVRREPDGTATELTPAPVNVRTRVHEYGGGSYTVAGGIVVYSEFRDGRLYRLDPGASDDLTHGLRWSPTSTARFATRPAATITCGFEVFVHDVIAAITTEPWSSS